MKSRHVNPITNLVLAVVLLLALLVSVGPAWANTTAAVDAQLIEAARGRDLAKVKTLLAKGADVNAKDINSESSVSMKTAILSCLQPRGDSS